MTADSRAGGLRGEIIALLQPFVGVLLAHSTTAVTKLSAEYSQWDHWQAEAPLACRSALILADEGDKSAVLPWLRAHFATLRQVDSFAVSRYGRTLYKWRIFRGEGFVP